MQVLNISVHKALIGLLDKHCAKAKDNAPIEWIEYPYSIYDATSHVACSFLHKGKK